MKTILEGSIIDFSWMRPNKKVEIVESLIYNEIVNQRWRRLCSILKGKVAGLCGAYNCEEISIGFLVSRCPYGIGSDRKTKMDSDHGRSI